MYAVIKTCGKQYRVEPGATIRVDRMAHAEGEEIEFPALMVGGETLAVGTPTVEGAVVRARVAGHPRGEKVRTMKYRRRHRTRRRVGSRHAHTDLEILGIDLG